MICELQKIKWTRSVFHYSNRRVANLSARNGHGVGRLAEFLNLLRTHNERVNAVESDKSMMIEITANLQPK
jgi:hypothetical protein